MFGKIRGAIVIGLEMRSPIVKIFGAHFVVGKGSARRVQATMAGKAFCYKEREASFKKAKV